MANTKKMKIRQTKADVVFDVFNTVFMVVLMFVILATLDYRLGQGAEWYKLLANLLLLQSWVPADSFYFVANGSSWFLCDILFFYS